MRCNPLRWLWGLIPIAMLALLANHWERAGIETDLTERTKAELTKQGLDWAGVKFEGRNATVTGRASDEGEPKLAGEKVRNTWGVYTTKLDTDLVAAVSKYGWQATRDGRKLTLTGHVPTEQVRKSILAQAKSSIGKGEIIDQMTLARGAPKSDLWLAGTGFALKQLALLKSGSVSLEPTALSIAGEAADQGSFKSLKAAIPSALPTGWTLASEKVTAPAVSPFTWNAKLTGNQLVLAGYVPSEAVREDIFARAKKAFPKYAVIDRTEIAAGAPAEFTGAVTASLDQLYQLKHGTAEIKDATVRLTGVADDESTANTVKAAFQKGVPQGFKGSEAISFDRPMLARVANFQTDVAIGANDIEVTGQVPNEDGRKALLDAIRNAFFGRRIVDRTELADGAPAGWFTCAAAGVSALARIGNGKASLSGSAIDVTGHTADASLAAAVPGELKSAAGRACEPTANISVDQPAEAHLWWHAEHTGNDLVLSGQAPDASARAALAAAAAATFPGARIVDNLSVVSKRSSQWQPVTEKALKLLSQLKSGVASVFHDEVVVAGEAADAGVKKAISARLASELPKGYTGRDDIWIVTAPVVDTAAAEAARKAAAEAEAARKAEAAAAAAEAARVKAEEDARKAAEAAEAKRRAEEEAAALEAKRRADAEAAEARLRAEEEAARKAEAERQAALERQKREDEAGRCQQLVRDAAAAGTIRFQFASDKLEANSTPTLQKLAKIVNECPGTRIEIGGHTSADGDPTRNQNLSERRARSVADFLIKSGVDAGRLTAVGYGFQKPVAPNDTEANRAKNRRIEFSVVAN